MSPLEIIVLMTAATMLSAQVMTETIVQTKKPRCISVLRPIPQPERQQLSARVSRLPSPPSPKSSPPTSGAKPPNSSGPKPLSSAGPPKSPSPSTKSPSKFPKARLSTGPKSPYSGSNSLSAGPRSLSSTGPRPQSSGSKSLSTSRKSSYFAGPPSNPPQPPALARTSPDSFSLFKLPLQLISNVLMPSTIKRNKSSVIAPLINFQMPLTFTTIHGAPNRVPCKIITDPSNPGTCTDAMTGNRPPAVPVPSFGTVLYEFLCKFLLHKIIDLPPDNTTWESITTTTTTTTNIDTNIDTNTTTTTTTTTTSADTTTPTTAISAVNTTTVTTAPTTDGTTDTTIITTAEPKTTTSGTAVPTQTPADDEICKFISCSSPVLRYIILKHAVCKSSLLSTCRINKPVNNNKQHSRRPAVAPCHPGKFHARNDAPWPSSRYGDKFDSLFATESRPNHPVTSNNAQEELLLKLLEILISTSNRPPPVTST